MDKNTTASSLPEPVACVHHRSIQDNRTPRVWIHREHYLSLLLRGDGYGRNGSVVYPRTRPLFCFTPAGREDVNGLVGPVAAWWVGFRWPGLVAGDDGADADLVLGDLRTRAPAMRLLDAEAAADVTRRFARIAAALARPGLAAALQARAAIVDLLSCYLDLEPAGAGSHRAIVRFRDALERRAYADEPLTAIARGCGLQPNRLREVFHARYGMTPIAYRTDLRVARARQLLAGTALGVAEVAAAVGYADPLYFSRVFRARAGVAPSDFIRRRRA